MKKLMAGIPAYWAKKLDLYRRRKHRVKVEVATKDHKSVIRDYTFVAVPRTLEKKEYDVRIRRSKRFGPNVEVVDRVWTRDYLEQFVHDNA